MEIICDVYPINIEDNKKENEKWIDFLGNRKVWLKIVYNQKGHIPLTDIELTYYPSDHDHLVIKQQITAFFFLIVIIFSFRKFQ